MGLGSALSYISERIDINPRFIPTVTTSVAISTAGALACFSKNEKIKIPGMTITIATVYGILNDMIACRDSIEYFTVGHFWDNQNLSNRLIMNLDPNINAIFWGIAATTTVSLLAGCIFSCLARSTTASKEETNNSRLDTRVTAKQIFPYLSIFSVINFIHAHIESRKAQQIMSNGIEAYREAGSLYENPIYNTLIRLGLYKAPTWNVPISLDIPLNMQAGWKACSVRNNLGYQGLALGTMLISTGIVATRMFRLLLNRYRSSKEN